MRHTRDEYEEMALDCLGDSPPGFVTPALHRAQVYATLAVAAAPQVLVAETIHTVQM